MNNDFRYMKFIYLHCGEETNLKDPRRKLVNWTFCFYRELEK